MHSPLASLYSPGRFGVRGSQESSDDDDDDSIEPSLGFKLTVLIHSRSSKIFVQEYNYADVSNAFIAVFLIQNRRGLK